MARNLALCRAEIYGAVAWKYFPEGLKFPAIDESFLDVVELLPSTFLLDNKVPTCIKSKTIQ